MHDNIFPGDYWKCDVYSQKFYIKICDGFAYTIIKQEIWLMLKPEQECPVLHYEMELRASSVPTRASCEHIRPISPQGQEQVPWGCLSENNIDRADPRETGFHGDPVGRKE